MNKKLFSLLVLLMAAVTGAWADKPTFVNGTKFTADDQFDQIYMTQPTYDYALTTKNAEHCTITFFVGGKEVTGANEGDEVTFTVVADMGWTVDESSVIAQYNVDPSHAGARRMDPEQNPTMDMLDEVSLTHETGTNVWTFKMQSADVLVTVKYEPRLAWKQGETTLDNRANVYYYKGMPFISPRLSNPDGLENVD